VIDPRDIVDTNDIRAMTKIGVTTLFRWRNRPELKFPRPIRTVGSGLDLYDRNEIQDWLNKNTVVGRNGTIHVRYSIYH